MTTGARQATMAAPDDVLNGALAELRELIETDGAMLRLVSVEEPRRRITLAVDLDGVECADCVLPPEQLRSVVEAGFQRRIESDCEIVLLDPRTPAAAIGAGSMQVLDPRGAVDVPRSGTGPAAGGVSGKRVGFRVDVLWPAWDIAVDEWSTALRDAGAAATLTWRRLQGLTGQEGQAKQAEYVEFLRSVDVAIVGLGNCGGCTAYTVEDALTALDEGLPTIAVATAHFEPLARSLSAHRGRPDLPLVILPYPFHTLPEAEVRAAARSLTPELLGMLEVTV